MKVLVSSLSRDFGGVESLFLNLAQSSLPDDLVFDFVCTDSSAAREQEFISCGSRVIHISRPSRNLGKYFKEFQTLFKSHQYDIYHVNLTRFRFPLDIIIAKMAGIKVILHCHATQIYDVGSNKTRIIRKAEQKLFKPIFALCSDQNLACSVNAGKYLFGQKPYQVIHNGIHLEKFSFNDNSRHRIREEMGLEGKKIIGHVGRFSLEKNHAFMLRIMRQLIDCDDNYRLLLVGDGDLFGDIQKEVRENALDQYVIFTGQRRDIADLLSAMDVFLFPSIHEALPITLLEAQMNGLPCVVSENITEELDVNENIFRISLDEDPIKWVKEIIYAFGDRLACSEINKFKDFEITTMKLELQKIYNSVCTNV